MKRGIRRKKLVVETISFLFKEFYDIRDSISMSISKFGDMRDFIVMNKFNFTDMNLAIIGLVLIRRKWFMVID